MDKKEKKVSVICITYNHEEYIANALDSFLMQKTTFPFQILVGEDCGSDRTADIVREYAEKYPDIIVPFIREKNLGAQGNLIDLCGKAQTEYVAFCEGDDYWTDEYKLQKQFELMEAHPEYKACFHNTKILADASWYLYGYYKKDKQGDISIPESIPGYDNTLRELRMDYYILYGPAHTSSLFYRWDSEKEIPDWYYRHIYGDHSLVMIQVGEGVIGYIPETMSAYRRSEVGVLMYENKTDHFLRSRESWIEMAVDLEKYYKQHYNMFANEEIRHRIAQEFNTYIRYIISSGRKELIQEAYYKHSYAASIAAMENVANKRIVDALINQYSKNGLKMLLKNALRNQVKVLIDEKNAQQENIERRRIKRRLKGYLSLKKKQKDKLIWVFSDEEKRFFKGNVRHFYEYIVAFHPEIKAYWLTNSQELIKFFQSEGLPHARIGTDECEKVMQRASVAVVDQFRTKAFDFYGFNKGIKVVRLGAGAEIEDLAKAGIFEECYQVRPEAVPEKILEDDSKFPKGIQINEGNASFLTENYADTFLQVASNEVAAEVFEKELRIPRENIFISGNPGTFAVSDHEGDGRKRIAFIPGERYLVLEQEKQNAKFYAQIERINDFLEHQDCYLDVYFGASYTDVNVNWMRNRMDSLRRVVVFGKGRDVYQDIDKHALLFTDWSKYMFDYARRDKPVVIINLFKEAYLERTALLYDYRTVLPGIFTDHWEDALKEAEKRLQDPTIDQALRRCSLEMVCDMRVHDENNCERIVNEVKRRLKLE